MKILPLALKSVANRRFSAFLTVLAIALSVAMLLGVERLRTEARASFANTISGVDLLVGARSGSIQLLLYAVFRIGNATNNMTWESYQDIIRHPRVAWAVPLSLGDSHRGFRVLGTSTGYFEHFRYGRDRALEFHDGRPFDDLFDAVIGAQVARELGYRSGSQIIIAHGAGDVSFIEHGDKPFQVVGVLAPTGTPVDRTVHISLEGYEAIHANWQGGAPVPGLNLTPEQLRGLNLQPKVITAAMLGLSSRTAVFGVQRGINEYPEEPLLAVLPGVALQQLWDLMGVAGKALMAVSALVVAVGITGMLTVILSGLEARRREMAILRSVGARPVHVFGLIVGEAAALTLAGILAGVALLYLSILTLRPLLASDFGLYLGLSAPSPRELLMLATVLASATVVAALPAHRAYKYSVADGMTIRL